MTLTNKIKKQSIDDRESVYKHKSILLKYELKRCS